MRKTLCVVLLLLATSFLFAQKADDMFNAKEAERIISFLASDEMRGRRVFSPEIDKAADFIAKEFKAAGLSKISGASSFRQEFSLVRPKFISAVATADRAVLEQRNVIAITCQPQFKVTQQSGYETVNIPATANLQTEARKIMRSNKNTIVWVPLSFANSFGNLSRLKSSMFKTNTNVVFVLIDKTPATFSIETVHEITEQKMANVVGMLPGKGKKEEYIIFSGHYDHIGVGRPTNGDSIYNGANDDAAGITGVILLAKYFAALKNNERTIIFAAFTAEESGGFGSQYFSRQFEPVKVMAMFNIEMIGTESKWGKSSAYITGYEKTNMGDILAKNLEGTGFTFYPDPYPAQQLFYRSDNATLARLGVPAHTISTSKMDAEPHYHRVSDEVKTLDMANIVMVIKAIGLSAVSIVAGKDTPTRVRVEELR
jgi:Zn-dependent M28 family amino/carboxypeptidase